MVSFSSLWRFLLPASAMLLSCGGDEEAREDFSRDVNLAEHGDLSGEREPLAPIPAGFVPDSARPDQIAALERANFYRSQSGLPPLDMLEAINLACQAHCDYYVLHHDKYASGALSPHYENSAWPEGFVGTEPWDRMGHFGYTAGASEVMAFVHNAEQAVDGWMNTLYHRIPFMDATLTACGYGAAGSGMWANSDKVDTMDFGWEDADGNNYTGPDVEGIYPPPGSSGIPPSFDGLESPQPKPPPAGFPSGTIISITWSSPGNFLATSHALWAEADGKELSHVWLDPSNDGNLQGSPTVAMYADFPLQSAAKYWVVIEGERNGKPYKRKWFFWTARY